MDRKSVHGGQKWTAKSVHRGIRTCSISRGKRGFLPCTKAHQTPQGVFGWAWASKRPPQPPQYKPGVGGDCRSTPSFNPDT